MTPSERHEYIKRALWAAVVAFENGDDEGLEAAVAQLIGVPLLRVPTF